MLTRSIKHRGSDYAGYEEIYCTGRFHQQYSTFWTDSGNFELVDIELDEFLIRSVV